MNRNNDDSFDLLQLLGMAISVAVVLQISPTLRTAVFDVMGDITMWILRKMDGFCRDYLIMRKGVTYVLDGDSEPGKSDTP